MKTLPIFAVALAFLTSFAEAEQVLVYPEKDPLISFSVPGLL